GRVQQAADAPNRKAAEDAGNTIITLTDEQIAEWKTAAEPTVAGWIEDVKARGIDGQALFDEAKATIAACASELRSTFAN
ncbi:MAG: C4-dicarboxylate ABC transporter, partial [Pseudomonadota bacterium]